MSAAVALPIAESRPRLFTVEELLAMPDDGKDRWLIRDQLREQEMTKRNRFHSALVSRLSQLIGAWIDAQPEPRGEVYGGEASVYLARNPDSCVGIDVVYVAPDVVASQINETTLIDGVPTLVIEILSPYDVKKDVTEKINDYLTAGVPLVWIVDTDYQTVTVHRPGQPIELFNTTQTLSADPHLPGFTVPVERIFRR
jgi:Uma2 family endonuclease